jgi:hypothetical protein
MRSAAPMSIAATGFFHDQDHRGALPSLFSCELPEGDRHHWRFDAVLPDGRAAARRVDEATSGRAVLRHGAAWSANRMAGERRVKIRFSANSPSRSAMGRGVGLWKIFAWRGLLLAGALYMVAPLQLPALICCLAADSNGLGSLVEIEVNGASAHQDGSATNDEEPGQLFGMKTEPVTDGALLDKWRRVEATITKDLEVIAQCQASQPCPAPAQKLIDLSLEGAGRSGRARVGVLNRAVNLAIRPVSDEMQWGVSDHWSDPLETLGSNSGDCEDYAIVKYVALLVAGLSKNSVKDRRVEEPSAKRRSCCRGSSGRSSVAHP